MLRAGFISLMVAASVAAFGQPAAAKEKLTIVYLDPASPKTSMFRVAEWPSFLFTAGAPFQVSYVSSRLSGSVDSTPTGDLDCADISGPVDVSGGDPNGLDRDGDGIGCE